ncbi:MAG: VWA domain-containing protein [Deltaproteobacteria bacterium]|nr:VWA domain-containing protein [Deltaproteobacteria bacterium]
MAGHVLAFARLCKRSGLPAHPAAAVDACRALSLLGVGDPRTVYWALRGLLVSSPDQIPVFDRLFHAYWESGSLPEEPPPQPPCERPSARPGQGSAGDEGESSLLSDAEGGASDREVLLRKDLRHVTPEEEPRVRAAFLALLHKLASRPGRRHRPSYRGRSIEFRRVFRQSLRYGGEIVRLTRQEPRLRKRNLVLLGDVSGSMDVYNRFFLLMAHGLARRDRGVRVFGFSTRLFDLTDALRDRDATRAVARVGEQTRGWSGGTLIGRSLAELNRALDAAGPRRGLVVVVFSDGWDRGDPDLLTREMGRLRARAWRILWLNPLKGDPDYQPLCRGMAAALPFLDGFYPAHTAESLLRVAQQLQRLR